MHPSSTSSHFGCLHATSNALGWVNSLLQERRLSSNFVPKPNCHVRKPRPSVLAHAPRAPPRREPGLPDPGARGDDDSSRSTTSEQPAEGGGKEERSRRSPPSRQAPPASAEARRHAPRPAAPPPRGLTGHVPRRAPPCPSARDFQTPPPPHWEGWGAVDGGVTCEPGEPGNALGDREPLKWLPSGCRVSMMPSSVIPNHLWLLGISLRLLLALS
ncbi:atherin-like isoform X2 [Equus quagga]|uniref:atherin-like isoform X2 n=1 Tax=Equus quagga TaxID=89248 RepID=UPI001EE32B53|nr:atherin-like isoform X2 [Equus quagga]